MQMPEIQDQIKRTIHFDGVVSKAGKMADAISVALENIDVGYADKIDPMHHIVTIYADNEEELSEKTSELFSHIEMKSINVCISHSSGEEEIKGFSLKDQKEAFTRHYQNTVWYGGKSYWSTANEMINHNLPKNFIQGTNSDDQEVVIFFNTYNDLFDGMSDEDKEVYADEYAANPSINDYDIDEEIQAYGDIIVLNLSCASEFVELS